MVESVLAPKERNEQNEEIAVAPTSENAFLGQA